MPGPADQGPYPTVVEYSGYSPADPTSPQPSTLIASALGFATVGVNIRGTGCSGGAFQFFEPLQWTDGYDVIEAIAAQPWVAHGKVGMVGISYPGISQLFTAITRPPHLAAIAPLSVISDTGRGTLRPGGIFNDGFALSWASERQHDAQAAPASGQSWAGNRIRGGDTVCAANQALRSQAPDVLQMIEDHPYYDGLAVTLTPDLMVNRINVPVFLAGAWQDEQTGPYFANMLDKFTGTDKVWFSVTNGAHTDSLDPAILDRWIEFLQIYVAQAVPKRPPIAAVVAAAVGQQVWHTSVTLPPDRFANATSLAQARATFEADPRLRILFENGAGAAPGLPYARFESDFSGWPVPGTQARPWYFGSGSTLVDGAAGPDGSDAYTYDAGRAHVTTLGGDRPGVGVVAAAGLELDRTRGGKRGCLRDGTARVRHRDGRDGQRRSLDQDRRPRRRPPSDDHRGASGRQGGARAERLAARQLAGARTERDGAAALAHEHRRRRRELDRGGVEPGARRDLPVRACVPRRLQDPGHHRRAGRQPAALDVRRADRTGRDEGGDRPRWRSRVADRAAGRVRGDRAPGAAGVPVVARSAVPDLHRALNRISRAARRSRGSAERSA